MLEQAAGIYGYLGEHVSVTWRTGALMWALINVIVAQTAAPDDLLSWGLTLAGVTIPFAVGWAWNKQWREAVTRQNEFLKEQDGILRQELVSERAEKLKAHDDADQLRSRLTEMQVDLMLAKGERDQLMARIGHLEEVVRLRKGEKPADGVDRRQRDRLLRPESDPGEGRSPSGRQS